ncbi:ATP-binding protein [Flavobacterium aurantiibacter]|uniref:Cell division protein n=1 Tax=Flavobacterium aurantiibacter TaxID=2023067 RepID=A0A256A298_9FLAO|nr:ATP-binding protein [Flavobacterium aurantiibacter]OYQ47771.1 cell division protein [Flavobacterium aurantiibacter]
MNPLQIESLREALKHSPDNIPLRQMLAEALLAARNYAEAEDEFLELLKRSSSDKIKFGLAQVYFAKENYSASSVILEELFSTNTDPAIAILYAKTLIEEDAISKAIEVYQKSLRLHPHHTDDELDQFLRNSSNDLDYFENDLEGDRFHFLEKPDISFKDVGGMDHVKKEIELKIIKPLLHPELYKAYGKKIGGGILLYGPPGCGKTYIAKATAGEVQAKFLNVSLNDILDMWIGNSEKNLHEIFELARKNQPCVLFIDEIDALGASRSDMKTSSSRHLINQFLQELDGIDGSNEGVLVIGATNAPWSLDQAFRRPGRFDRIIFVPPPDAQSRERILQVKLQQKPTEKVDLVALAKKSEHFSGADLDAVIDIAIEQKLEQAFVDGIPKPLNTNDLIDALKKHKPSTQEWFATARNFALFANDSGLYDDILNYLKIKK